MAGHSHSSNIKFRKDRVDRKRAQAFAKLSRTITVAARQGGGSVDGNARLRLCVERARVLGMPKDGIERAIRKGTGAGSVGDYEEVLYEGYGPGGVALMLEILTDNRHRTAADVRAILEKYGGNLGTSGAVAWMFERRGRFVVATRAENAAAWTPERLLDLVLATGGDDLVDGGAGPTILCPAPRFAEVQGRLVESSVPLQAAELAWIPTQRTVVADGATAKALLRLIDELEANDDVQAVHGNEEFPDAVLGALEV